MFKSQITFLVAILFSVIANASGFDKNALRNPETKKAAIENLLIGLSSDNFGLRTSSAYMLGEIKADEAVVPLMNMLRTEKNEDARIVAALALYKIEDSRGVFAVKQAIRFDKSDRVKKLCSNFYNQILRERYFPVEYADSIDVAIK